MDASSGLVVLLVISSYFALMYALGRNERAKRSVACPQTNSTGDVDVVQRYGRPDQPVRVERCSLLPEPERVDCGQECLKRATQASAGT